MAGSRCRRLAGRSYHQPFPATLASALMDHLARRPLPQDMAQRIESWVRAGRYPPGSRLPPERELAIRLGTSRNVLREALRILETRGWVEIRHGIGTFVTKDIPEATTVIPVSLDLEPPAPLPIDQVMVARRAVECAVVEVAAHSLDDIDIEALREVLGDTARCVATRNQERYVEMDLRFHELLGACTHNPLLQEVQVRLTRATSTTRNVATETHDAMQAAIRFHGEILDALVRRDAEAARASMLLHLVDANERVLAALSERANWAQAKSAQANSGRVQSQGGS